MKKLLPLLLFSFIINCHFYSSLVIDKIELKDSFPSKDEALIALLQAIADNDWEKANCYKFNKEEFFTIYHPNAKEFPSIVSKMKPEEAWPMVELKQKIGLDKLRQRLTGKKISKVEYMYRKGRPEYMRLGNLILWMPDAVKVYSKDGNIFIIEQIATIAENHGRFKVSSLKTG